VGQSAASAVAGRLHGFTSALTSFVGRADAVAEVAGLLERYRLVTVTGPGGSGKTRLAAEVARGVTGRFADGVWLAELAAVRDPAQAEQIPAEIPGWIARACSIMLILGLIETGDLAAAERSCRAGLARARDAGDLRDGAAQPPGAHGGQQRRGAGQRRPSVPGDGRAVVRPDLRLVGLACREGQQGPRRSVR
jgi:hypothetical protein